MKKGSLISIVLLVAAMVIVAMIATSQTGYSIRDDARTRSKDKSAYSSTQSETQGEDRGEDVPLETQDISACGSYGTGTHLLTQNIGSGGDCITITGNNVIIDGQGLYTINGDIDARRTSNNAYSGLELRNLTVTGIVYADGADRTMGDGGGAGYNGSDVTVINSQITTIYTNGGENYCLSDLMGDIVGPGGSGGDVTLTNSNVTTIYTYGEDNVFGGGSICPANGGDAGDITLTNSNVDSIYNYGGEGSSGSTGGFDPF